MDCRVGSDMDGEKGDKRGFVGIASRNVYSVGVRCNGVVVEKRLFRGMRVVFRGLPREGSMCQ